MTPVETAVYTAYGTSRPVGREPHLRRPAEHHHDGVGTRGTMKRRWFAWVGIPALRSLRLAHGSANVRL